MAQQIEIDRVLRCRTTSRYLKDLGWTEHLAEAWVFPTEFDAVQTCKDKRLTGVELVLRLRGDNSDLFAMPIE